MPLYEYFCRRCEAKFELLRPMSRSEAAATCPSGHADAQRVLSLFASYSKGADGARMAIAGSGGGCAGCAGGHCATCGA